MLPKERELSELERKYKLLQEKSIELLKKNDYGKYLENLLNKINGGE